MHSVFALIRFSFLPNDNRGFNLTKNLPFEKKKEMLFSEARMNRRFEVFEHVCLPSLVAQPSNEFGAVFLASEFMPDQFKERLKDLLTPYPNLLPTFESPRPSPYSEAFLKPLRQMDQINDIILTCRLDDDDALSSDYTKQVLRYINSVNIGHCVTFPRGLQAARLNDEPRFWESFYPLIGAGLGYIDRFESGRTIYDCGHHQKIWNKLPTLVDGSSPQYIVTLHGENDSTSRDFSKRESRWKRVFNRVFNRSKNKLHRNDLRNPPKDTYSLEQVKAQYPGCFAALTTSDWSFL